jgi:hypothetical protein
MLYLVALAPLFTWFATFGLAVSRSADDLIIASVLTAFAWPIYRLLRRRYGGPPDFQRRHIEGLALGRGIIDVEE